MTQDAFLKLYERWTALNWVVEYPPAWVHQVAVWAAIRRATREKVAPVAEPVDRATADQVPDPDLMNDAPVDQMMRFTDLAATRNPDEEGPAG